MSSFNKRFLVAPMIAVAACAMLVMETRAGGQPNRAAPRPALVSPSAMSRKPTTGSTTKKTKPAPGSTTSGKKTSGIQKGTDGQGGLTSNKPPGKLTRVTGGDDSSSSNNITQDGGGNNVNGSPGAIATQGDKNIIIQNNNKPTNTNNANANNSSGSDGSGRGTWGGPVPISPPSAAATAPVPQAIPSEETAGEFAKRLAEAKDQREETRGKKIENDQRERELQRSEHEKAPSPGEEQRRAKMEEVRRAVNAPVEQIYSAKAPNTLLDDLKDYPGLYQSRNPEVSLDADSLRKINVVSAGDTGNIGLLKKELTWPAALRGAEYQEPREALTSLAAKTMKEAVGGSVEATTLREMKAALGELNTRLAGRINQLPNARYIEAKRYLGQFDDAFRLLAKPHAGNYFNGKFSAQGKTVADLVRYMSKEGLKFAPAVGGDEGAYETVHRALAAFDVAAHGSVASTSSHSSRTE